MAPSPLRPPRPPAYPPCAQPQFSNLSHALDLVASHDGSALLALGPTPPAALVGPALDNGASGSVMMAIGSTLIAPPLPISVPPRAATRAAAALRTPTVWADRRAVVVAVQLSDGAGHTSVERSGLSLELELESAGRTASAACTAGLTGLATCRCDVPAGWFDTAPTTAVAHVQLSYDGAGVALRQSAGTLTVSSRLKAVSRQTSGMVMSWARSPRHVGDVIEAAVLADLIGVDYGLMAWSATLTYDATVRAAPDLALALHRALSPHPS